MVGLHDGMRLLLYRADAPFPMVIREVLSDFRFL